MSAASNYFDWQHRLILPELGSRVLEIGCGMGNFTEHLVHREMVIGIDVIDECVKAHRQRFTRYPNVTCQKKDVLDPSFTSLQNYRLDSVVCLNVLEHIENDHQALRQIHEVLPPGGRAIFIVPAFESLYGPIDAKLGHYRRYSKKSLRTVAEQAGFRIRQLRYMNFIGYFGWWINAHLLHKTEQSPAQIQFFDRQIVPLLSSLEMHWEPPWGQSLFTVLVKP